MAGIRGKNTKIEIVVRKELFRRGFRYRINDKNLPGKPDIVLPRRNAVVFINGCFWHVHGCSLFRLPSTNTEFWKSKLETNRLRDQKNYSDIRNLGWRLCVVWECALRGAHKVSPDEVADRIGNWLEGCETMLEIKG